MMGKKACRLQLAVNGYGAWRRAAITMILATSLAQFPSFAQSAPPATPSAPNCARALPNIQQCITAAAWSDFTTKTSVNLEQVAAILRSGMKTDRGPSLYYRTYWLAYTNYRAALVALTQKRLDRARLLLADAGSLLDNLAVKDQESYALQDLVLLLSFAGAKPDEIGPLISKTSELRGKLAKSTSIRALYALAVADYYTPKQFGGGRVAESLLRQALAINQDVTSQIKPSWGRDDCAALLIQILRQAGSNDKTTKLYNEAHKRYPNSLALAQVAGTQ
jgi:tetratricopeptide (TPR) repeat protein